MTPETIERIADTFGRALDVRDKRIAALEQRLDELEERQKNFKYVGVYEHGRRYERGNFVTEEGQVWHCNVATSTRPGPGTDWTLAVRKGKDKR